MKSDLSNIQLISRPQSLTYGRRVYRFKKYGQYYYIKCQSVSGHAQFKQGFKNEYAFYAENYAHGLTLSFQTACLENLSDLGIDEPQKYSAFIVPEAYLVFLEKAPTIFNDQEIMNYILKCCEPLERLHQAGYIHGDIKREHFVSDCEKIHLIDFEQTICISQTKMPYLNATPRYMAPELFHGGNKTVQTDLYAFGVVLYEWLMQQRLTVHSYESWAKLHCQQYFYQLPRTNYKLQKIIMGLLEKRTEDRLKTVSALKQEIYSLFR